MKRILIISLIAVLALTGIAAQTQTSNDVILSGGTYADLTYTQSGTVDDPVVVYGNGSVDRMRS